MRNLLALSLALPALCAVAAPGQADPASVPNAASTCRDCTLALPADQSNMPLVVVLPDQGEQPAHAAERYRADALARGWAVLVVPCPTAGGCTNGDWSAWRGPARYVTEAVASVEREHLFDTSHIFLAGHGAGGTFATTNAAELRGTFAALVVENGGRAPAPRSECPRGSLPMYLVGTTADTKRLRTYYARCEQQVTVDESGKASTKQILDWMNQHARPVLVSAL